MYWRRLQFEEEEDDCALHMRHLPHASLMDSPMNLLGLGSVNLPHTFSRVYALCIYLCIPTPSPHISYGYYMSFESVKS